jgi:hypothetical protein
MFKYIKLLILSLILSLLIISNVFASNISVEVTLLDSETELALPNIVIIKIE